MVVDGCEPLKYLQYGEILMQAAEYHPLHFADPAYHV
jgi:hypothetical protein